MRRFSPIRLLALLMVLTGAIHAQQYVFRAYQQAEGLKNLGVDSLAQDSKGFFWVATENGVYRFLGASFERFGPEQGIAELFVRDLVVDPDDTIWVGTIENLYHWDGHRFVPAGSSPIHITNWNSMAVEDARHLLVVEHNRLYRLEHDEKGRMLSYTSVFPENLVAANPDLTRISSLSVVSEPSNAVQIWVGSGKKLYCWQEQQSLTLGGRIQTKSGTLTEWGKEKGLAGDVWESVMRDHAGTLWAGGRFHIAVLPGGAARFEDRSIPGSNPGNSYHFAPLVEDREGRVLVPSEDGIARWDRTHWQTIGRANGLQQNGHIVGLVFDKTGDLWLATRGSGLYNWAGYEDWEGWNDVQKLPSPVIWSIVPASDGRLFIGTDKGPAWIDSRSGASGGLFSKGRWTFGQVDSMGLNRDGSLWGGTFSAAVLRMDARNGKSQQTAKLPAFITRTVADSSGDVFFTTDDGIYEREPGDSRAVPRRVKAVDVFLKESTQVDAGCLAPDGTLWFLANKRLLRLRAGQWTEPPIDGMPSRLPGMMLDMSCAADGAIWLTGEQTGIWRLLPAGDRLSAWQLQLPREMQMLVPVAIVADRRGWVWLGTDSGVLVWNGLSWRHLTQESGLIWNDVNQGAMLSADDGSLWIGTSGGIAHLLHPEHVFDSVPLNALVTGIRRGDSLYSTEERIKLKWSPLPLNFQISSPAMRNRSELNFKYRMEGLQPNWIESHDGMAIFSAIPPGKYTFVAMASNSGLLAYSSPVKVEIDILPPWWRSLWFYSLCVLVFLLLVGAGDWLRAQRLRQARKRLEELVRERTRDLEISREKLRVQANHDSLTGMLNRRGILRALAAEIDRARREHRTIVVALADIDYFKRINDSFGHLAGDEALRRFAAAVDAAIRSYDHAGRYGGEEFLLVLTEVPREAAELRMGVLHTSISMLQIHTRESRFALNCSIGATVFDPSGSLESVDTLLSVIDRALYAAKSAGRNRVVFHSEDSLHACLEKLATKA